MGGSPGADGSGAAVRHAHEGGANGLLGPDGASRLLTRSQREELEDAQLAPGATRASGAGRRSRPEEPDPLRTCFERDRDRILHAESFRRLAGKTQVFVFPEDHQRTRLTHALEVAQVAVSIATAVGANVALTEAIAHERFHVPAVRQILDRRRRERGAPPPLAVELPDDPRAKNLVVHPHDLASYDRLDDTESPDAHADR